MTEEKKKKLKREARLEVIKREYLYSTQAEIAEMCGVCRETISRDIKGWQLTDGFNDWLRKEFLELYTDVKRDDKNLAFREVNKLVMRTMAQRIESKSEGFGQLVIWRPKQDEDEEE